MCSTKSAAVAEILAAAASTGEEIVALTELIDQAKGALVERVAAFDAAQGWAADGASSFASWLRARADVSRGDACRLHRFTRTLRTMPATEAAVREGKLSVAKARVLAEVINPRTRERFAEQETFLVDQFQGLDVDAATTVARYWKRLADPDGPDPADSTRNRASMTKGWDDRCHLEADLDPTSGAIVHATLQAITERMHNDGRFNDRHLTHGQQQAEALVEMAMRSTGAGPSQTAVRPDIVVIVPIERLTEPEADLFAPSPGAGHEVGDPPAWGEVVRSGLLTTPRSSPSNDAPVECS